MGAECGLAPVNWLRHGEFNRDAAIAGTMVAAAVRNTMRGMVKVYSNRVQNEKAKILTMSMRL